MTSQNAPPDIPDPEVVPKAKRRRFSDEYKVRLMDEADNCTERGGIGGLLRREGLYFSHLATWHRQRDQGVRSGLRDKKRDRKEKDGMEKELARMLHLVYEPAKERTVETQRFFKLGVRGDHCLPTDQLYSRGLLCGLLAT